MVDLATLATPILLSTLAVFVASFLVWAVLPHHRSDFGALPDEEGVRAALRDPSAEPGQYYVPHAATRDAMKDPGYQEKLREGPVAFLTVTRAGAPRMGTMMAQQAIWIFVVTLSIAYVAGRTLAPGAGDVLVFRMVATMAWLAYGAAVVQDAIWFGRPWGSAMKMVADALLYGLLTGLVFAWLWPA